MERKDVMEFHLVMAIIFLAILDIATIAFLVSTVKLGFKLASQFKCNKCGKYNAVLLKKCGKCNKQMEVKETYRYKSTIFGRVSIKDSSGNRVMIKAITWIVIDFVIILAIALGLTYLIYLVLSR